MTCGCLRVDQQADANSGTIGRQTNGSRPVRQHHVGGFLTTGKGWLMPVSSHVPQSLSAGWG